MILSLKFVGQASRLETQEEFLLESWGRIPSPGNLSFHFEGKNWLWSVIVLLYFNSTDCNLKMIFSVDSTYLAMNTGHISKMVPLPFNVADHKILQ